MDIEKAMNFLKNTVTRDNGFSPVFIANMDILIGYAEEQLNYRWILVSERLPREGKKVLITTNEYYPVYCVALIIDGEWKVAWNFDKFGCLDVIAWMELPEPYKDIANES